MKKLVKYVLIDILRNKIMIAYTVLLLVLSFSTFNLEDNVTKGIMSLLNLLLLIVPLVSILFSATYIYNSVEFLELMASQPLRRKTIWLSIFTGISISLCLAFLVGIGIPVALYAPGDTGILLVAVGCVLSVSFVAIALLATVKVRDKAKGIGIAVLLWFYFAVLFDGILLFLLFQFADYPIEKPMIAVSFLNPIDVSRIMILLSIDESALMGYTGAVYRNFFGNSSGRLITIVLLLLWSVIPTWLSARKFSRKDL